MNRVEAGKLGYLKSKEFLAKQREKASKEAIDKFNKENKKCPTCDVKITFEKRQNKFCSHKCSAIFNNPRKIPKTYGGKCAQCQVNTPKINRKFCEQCISSGAHLRYKQTLQECLTDNARKRFLLRQQEHKCEICSNTEWNNKPIPLELDHIDGNHKNNKKDNLRIICPNCHAQTPTYKAKNKGNGRKHRRIKFEP